MILLAGNVAPARGGVERTLEHVTAELTERGREVGALTFWEQDPPPGARAVPVRVAWARGVAAVVNPFRLTRAVVDAVGEVEGEVEQVWARNAEVAAAVAVAFPSLPLVFIPPGTYRLLRPWERRGLGTGPKALLRELAWRVWFGPLSVRRERRALLSARAVVVFSENMRRMITEDHGDAVGGRVLVVPPGVDGERFRPPADAPVEAPPGRTVAFLGRLAERKGVGLLVEAMRRIPDAELLVIGDGPRREGLEERARAADVRATFLGRVDEPAGPLAGARVLVVPSIIEPFGHVLLEGLALGLPVVGFSRASGSRTAVEDVVRDGVNGVLVHERSADALAAGVERGLALGADPAVRERCRREVLERYRWDRFVDRVLALGSGGSGAEGR